MPPEYELLPCRLSRPKPVFVSEPVPPLPIELANVIVLPLVSMVAPPALKVTGAAATERRT